jgi:cation transport regulator ChaB
MPDTVTVPGTLKGHAATIWRSAFLSAYDGTCKDSGGRRDECAARVAWSAVKQSYRQNEQDEWVAKAGKPWEKKKPEDEEGNPPPAAQANQAPPEESNQAPPADPNAPQDPNAPADPNAQVPQEAPGDRTQQPWHDAFAVALLGECVKSADPILCAVQTADAAVFGTKAEDKQAKDKTQTDEAAQGQTTGTPPPAEGNMPQKSVLRFIHRNDFGDLSLPVVIRKDYSPEKRSEFSKKGWALPDGSYPIADMEDLRDAIHSFGRAPESRQGLVKAHITKRARQLDAMDKVSPEWGGKEGSLTARVRDEEEDFDQQLLDQNMGNQIVKRPDYINSNDWMKRPLQQRTVGYLIQERALSRSYEGAVERSIEGGWQAIRNPTRAEEYIFQRWLDSMDGMLLQRAVLVRKAGTMDWHMRELTRGAALSLAVQIPLDERRYGDNRF